VTERQLPSRAEPRELLRAARGWVRVTTYGSEGWQHPRYEQRILFSLATAYRVETRRGQPSPDDDFDDGEVF
jgi:hypothetical protein